MSLNVLETSVETVRQVYELGGAILHAMRFVLSHFF